jgi:hypothetical protein
VIKDGQLVDLSAPWPERTVWPYERTQVVSAEDLHYEVVYGSRENGAEMRERLEATVPRAEGI